MDEPLASLDEARKRETLPYIERLRDEFAVPILYVRHSRFEIDLLRGEVVEVEEGMKHMLTTIAVGFGLTASAASAQATLSNVQEKGFLTCG